MMKPDPSEPVSRVGGVGRPGACGGRALRRLAAEAAEEFLERVGLLAHRDALLGRDVDHRGLRAAR